MPVCKRLTFAEIRAFKLGEKCFAGGAHCPFDWLTQAVLSAAWSNGFQAASMAFAARCRLAELSEARP
jgi:hypothetical protein